MTASMKIVIAVAIAAFPLGLLVRAGVTSAQERRQRDQEDARRRKQQFEADQRRQAEYQRQQDEENARRRIQEEEGQRLREIVENLRPLIAEARMPGVGPIAVRGKAAIWDQVQGGLSHAHVRLPEDFRGKSGDKELTVFVVVEKRNEAVATYNFGNPGFGGMPRPGDPGVITGYQIRMEVCAVYWPSRKVAGRASVLGDLPPERISRANRWDLTPVYGSTDGALASWVQGLRRAGPGDPK